MKIVIALGGNALLKKHQKLSVLTQFKNAKNALKNIIPLIKSKHKIIITHGNGPQVGACLIRVEKSLGKTYSLPLSVCVAETEGEIGFIIEQSLDNLLREHHISRPSITILTQVLVSKKDKAFRNPTKPIGPFYSKAKAKKLSKKFKIKEDAGRGFRRVVPSPQPLKILDAPTINKLVNANNIVIAAGGGGIPVIKQGKKLKAIDAVIDKDLASSCLASSLKADLLLIITNTDYVYLNYKKKNQKKIKKMNIKQAQSYMKQNHFKQGSMLPKIQAAIKFLKKSGKKVIITSPKLINKALQEKGGTVITK